jgi:hypothetical protein
MGNVKYAEWSETVPYLGYTIFRPKDFPFILFNLVDFTIHAQK